jgi:hypothetical protein
MIGRFGECVIFDHRRSKISRAQEDHRAVGRYAHRLSDVRAACPQGARAVGNKDSGDSASVPINGEEA